MNQAIARLQLDNAAAVSLNNAGTLVVRFPAVVAAFDPASLLGLEDWRPLIGCLAQCGGIDRRQRAVERTEFRIRADHLLDATARLRAVEGRALRKNNRRKHRASNEKYGNT